MEQRVFGQKDLLERIAGSGNVDLETVFPLQSTGFLDGNSPLGTTYYWVHEMGEHMSLVVVSSAKNSLDMLRHPMVSCHLH